MKHAVWKLAVDATADRLLELADPGLKRVCRQTGKDRLRYLDSLRAVLSPRGQWQQMVYGQATAIDGFLVDPFDLVATDAPYWVHQWPIAWGDATVLNRDELHRLAAGMWRFPVTPRRTVLVPSSDAEGIRSAFLMLSTFPSSVGSSFYDTYMGKKR